MDDNVIQSKNNDGEVEVEYVTHSELAAIEDRILASVTSVKGELSAKLSSAVEAKMKTERITRRKQVDELQGAVDRLNEQVTTTLQNLTTQLTLINSKIQLLESIPDLVNEMSKKVASLTSTITERDRTSAIHVRRLDERNEEQDRMIEVERGRIDNQSSILSTIQHEVVAISEHNTSLFNSMRQLHATIHGDVNEKSGAPSLFDIVNQIKTTIDVMHVADAKTHTDMLAMATANAARITSIQSSIDAQARMWAERRAYMWTTINELLRNRIAWVVTGGLLAGGLYGKEALLSFAKLISGIE